MNKRMKEMTITGLLTALAIVLPMFMPKVTIPPFTMTLASHVPSILAMFISPFAVIFVGLGNAIGFMSLGPIVVSRALTHILFGLIGYYLVKKDWNYILIGIITLFFHGLFEAIVTALFSASLLADGKAVMPAVLTALFGTWVHHAMDYIISTPIFIALVKSKLIDGKIPFKKKG